MTTHAVRRREVDGIPMRWLEAPGDGEPDTRPAIVLLHGIPTSPELWRRVIPHLAGHRVLAWEMVGYGGSIPTGVGRDLSLRRQTDYLLAWLDALGIARAVLAGHDLGGGVAQIAAVMAPDRVAGLALTNAVAYDSWPVLPIRLLRAGGGVFRRVPTPLWRRVFQGVIAAMHDDRQVGLESARTHWSHYADHGGGSGLVRQARSLDVADTLAVQDALSALDMPAGVVWGDGDRFQPVAYGARLARDLGTALRAIPGAGHFTPEDHPEPVAAVIREVAARA